MDANKKGAIAVGVVFGLVGVGYAIYYFWEKNRPKGTNKDVAYFIKDGFVYDTDMTQRYEKKSGDWGGLFVAPISGNKEYWMAKNSKAEPILLKKSDVKTEKIK